MKSNLDATRDEFFLRRVKQIQHWLRLRSVMFLHAFSLVWKARGTAFVRALLHVDNYISSIYRITISGIFKKRHCCTEIDYESNEYSDMVTICCNKMFKRWLKFLSHPLDVIFTVVANIRISEACNQLYCVGGEFGRNSLHFSKVVFYIKKVLYM